MLDTLHTLNDSLTLTDALRFPTASAPSLTVLSAITAIWVLHVKYRGHRLRFLEKSCFRASCGAGAGV